MRRIPALAAAAAACLFPVSPVPASEARVPDRYHGVWEPTEPGGAPTCAPNNADIRITVTAQRIDLHEGVCVVQGTVPGSDEPLVLQTYCEQEDSEWVANEQWSLGEEGGRRQLLVTSVDPGNRYEGVFGECEGTAVASAGGGAEAPASYCYRQEMTEFRLIVLGDGTADFEVESAQGGAHICGLAGNATSIERGYRYSENIDGIGLCALSMLFGEDGSVSFEDVDWTCQRFYCGARASFEHIELGPDSKVACD